MFHGASRVGLPVCPLPAGGPSTPQWGPLQALAVPSELGGGQRWTLQRDLMTRTARLESSRSERVRVDPLTVFDADHSYSAAVSASRPDLAHMQSTTVIAVDRPVSRTVLTSRTVTTTRATSLAVDIAIDGQPYWSPSWRFD